MISKADKEKILKSLSENPFITVACKKAGIARATFYRLKDTDDDFFQEVNKAMSQGRDLICEVAESNLIKRSKEGNVEACKYILRHNSRRYKTNDLSYDPNDLDDPIVRDFNRAYNQGFLKNLSERLKKLK